MGTYTFSLTKADKESEMRQNKTGEYMLVEDVLEIIRDRFYNDVP